MDATKKVISKAETNNFSDQTTGEIIISIKTVENEYFEDGTTKTFDLEGIDSVQYPEEKIFVNGKQAIEGELMITKSEDVNVQIDEVGFLLISGKNAEKYEINEQGELIYNY